MASQTPALAGGNRRTCLAARAARNRPVAAALAGSRSAPLVVLIAAGSPVGRRLFRKLEGEHRILAQEKSELADQKDGCWSKRKVNGRKRSSQRIERRGSVASPSHSVRSFRPNLLPDRDESGRTGHIHPQWAQPCTRAARALGPAATGPAELGMVLLKQPVPSKPVDPYASYA